MQSFPSRSNGRPQRADLVKLLDAVRSINKSIRAAARAVEQQVGISSAQLFILQELAEHPAQSINELANSTFTHQSSVSMVVSRLQEKGFVKRAQSNGDARRVSVSLTNSGLALVRRAPATAHSSLLRAFKTLTRDEVRDLCSSLTRVADMIADEQSREIESKGNGGKNQRRA
jgi:DNA-binding MarR family transcriptional regulator